MLKIKAWLKNMAIIMHYAYALKKYLAQLCKRFIFLYRYVNIQSFQFLYYIFLYSHCYQQLILLSCQATKFDTIIKVSQIGVKQSCIVYLQLHINLSIGYFTWQDNEKSGFFLDPRLQKLNVKARVKHQRLFHGRFYTYHGAIIENDLQ